MEHGAAGVVSARLLVARLAGILAPARVVHALVAGLQLLALSLGHGGLVLELGEGSHKRRALVDGQRDDRRGIALRGLWSRGRQWRRGRGLSGRCGGGGDWGYGSVRVAAFRAALVG